MIFNPDVLALLLTSLLVTSLAVLSSAVGIEILMKWDLKKGTERQLILERRTYLVSTIMGHLLVFEFLSLFLFVFCADRLHGLFVGAMCAAGSLNANDYGYPALIVKACNAILCGLWVVMNRLDNRGADYPLIRQKYKMLLFITGMLILEGYLTAGYFFGLRGEVITSCCGTLFSSYAEGLAADLASFPPSLAMILFFLNAAVILRLGINFLTRDKGAGLFALTSGLFFIVSIIGITSFISLYYYELPTHHCPFCILQSDYGYIGYPLYALLLGGTITGVGVGVLGTGRSAASVSALARRQQRKYCIASVCCFLAFTALSAYPMLFSDFRLEGY